MKKLSLLVISLLQSYIMLSQWSVERFKGYESHPTHYYSNTDNGFFLEIYHIPTEKSSSLWLNLNSKTELFNKEASLEIDVIKFNDTTEYTLNISSLGVDLVLEEELLNTEFGNEVFNSEKIIIEIKTKDKINIAEFNMYGIKEIYNRIKQYVYLDNYTWIYDGNGCIYEFEARLINHFGKDLNSVDLSVVVGLNKSKDVIYRKKHTLQVSLLKNEIITISIQLANNICIDNIQDFEKNYYVIIKQPEFENSILKNVWH